MQASCYAKHLSAGMRVKGFELDWLNRHSLQTPTRQGVLVHITTQHYKEMPWLWQAPGWFGSVQISLGLLEGLSWVLCFPDELRRRLSCKPINPIGGAGNSNRLSKFKTSFWSLIYYYWATNKTGKKKHFLKERYSSMRPLKKKNSYFGCVGQVGLFIT